MRQDTAAAALRDFGLAYDRSGSIASHRQAGRVRAMSASPPIATKRSRRSETSLRANSDRMHCSKKGPLFDHLIGAEHQAHGQFDAERLRSIEIEDERIFLRYLHGKVARFCAFQDAIDVGSGLSELVVEFHIVGYQTAISGEAHV